MMTGRGPPPPHCLPRPPALSRQSAGTAQAGRHSRPHLPPRSREVTALSAPTGCRGLPRPGWLIFTAPAHGRVRPGASPRVTMSAAVIEAAPGTLWLAPGEEADDRRRKRRRYALLDACSAQQSGVSGIAQVAALDEYFGDSGETEPGEIRAENDAIVAVIVACRHRGVGEEC